MSGSFGIPYGWGSGPEDGPAPSCSVMTSSAPLHPSTPNVPRPWSVAALVVSIAATAMAFGDFGGPVRVLATLSFMVLVPGAALASRMAPMPQSAVVGVVIASSLAICCLWSAAALWMHLWSPNVMLAVLAVLANSVLFAPPSRAQLRSRS